MFGNRGLLPFFACLVLLLSACQPIQPLQPRSEAPQDIPSAFADNNGIRIHYGVEGQGPPLVLMHGWAGSSKDWELFGYAEALKQTYRLIMIDARGHGESDKPHEEDAYDLETQAGDIVAVLDALGIEKAHYFGFSMGATIGWALATFAPDRFASLTLLGDAPGSFVPTTSVANMRTLGADGFAKMVAGYLSTFGASESDVYNAYASNDPEALVAAAYASAAEDFGPDLAGMNLPMQLVAGRFDDDYAAMKSAASMLLDASFVEIPGQDHVGSFMQTELIAKTITGFISELK